MKRRPLDDDRGGSKNGASAGVAVIVERPDPEGRRWQAVLDLLLEAGRPAQENDPSK